MQAYTCTIQQRDRPRAYTSRAHPWLLLRIIRGRDKKYHLQSCSCGLSVDANFSLLHTSAINSSICRFRSCHEVNVCAKLANVGHDHQKLKFCGSLFCFARCNEYYYILSEETSVILHNSSHDHIFISKVILYWSLSAPRFKCPSVYSGCW